VDVSETSDDFSGSSQLHRQRALACPTPRIFTDRATHIDATGIAISLMKAPPDLPQQGETAGGRERGNALDPRPHQKVRELVLVGILLIVFGGLVPGFLVGLLAFKVKSRWCPRCGESTETMHRAEPR
jgi:hypothetical protein